MCRFRVDDQLAINLQRGYTTKVSYFVYYEFQVMVICSDYHSSDVTINVDIYVRVFLDRVSLPLWGSGIPLHSEFDRSLFSIILSKFSFYILFGPWCESLDKVVCVVWYYWCHLAIYLAERSIIHLPMRFTRLLKFSWIWHIFKCVLYDIDFVTIEDLSSQPIVHQDLRWCLKFYIVYTTSSLRYIWAISEIILIDLIWPIYDYYVKHIAHVCGFVDEPIVQNCVLNRFK